jgi:hypothetical protein
MINKLIFVQELACNVVDQTIIIHKSQIINSIKHKLGKTTSIVGHNVIFPLLMNRLRIKIIENYIIKFQQYCHLLISYNLTMSAAINCQVTC